MGIKLMPLVAVGLLGLGNLLHIIGLATPEWTKTEVLGTDYSLGLWEGCAGDNCDSIDNDDKPDWYKGCEALAILGMLTGLVALLLILLIVVFGIIGKNSPSLFGTVAVVCSVLSFIFIIACVITFAVELKDSAIGSNFDDGFGYSFALSIVGAILILVGGILGFTQRHSS